MASEPVKTTCRCDSVFTPNDSETICPKCKEESYKFFFGDGDDDDFGDEEDDDEPPFYYCNSCGKVETHRPMGGECPRCAAIMEEDYL